VADSARQPKVLVVDDDEGLLVLIADTLAAEGYAVTTANSGASALSRLAEQTPDLMLLDLKMRDVGGAALLKQLRRHESPVPFIVVTGQGDEKIAVEVMKQGALDYVMKDSGLLDLLPSVVERALETVERERTLASAQAELRESEARFAAALRATNDGVWEWQIPNNTVYFSARWKAILGYQPHEIPDAYTEWQDRVHPGDRDRFAKAQEAFFAGTESVFGIEYRLRHKDGAYRWILLRAFLQRDAQGRPLRLTGADADVTERKQLEKEILRISDREQWRIGQELHDGLGQQLTAIELMAQSLKEDLQMERPDLAQQTSQMSRFLREAIAQTRSLAHGLTPFMLDAGGLQAALAELAQRTHSIGRVACRFVCPVPVPFKDAEAAAHLFRIAQESVGNALKHAGATEIVLTLTAEEGTVYLTIGDNGRGLPKTRKRREGIGLLVMRHRANTIGAELTIESKSGNGVIVSCSLRRNP
jgi:PAS domain S-box-containing protein